MEERKFEPVVLRWAREKRFGPKMEILLEHWVDSWKGVTPELIRGWENGSAEPTFVQVKKLAEIYKRPLAVFFLNSPPQEKENPPDLRTIGSKDHKTLSPEALLVIRKARRVQGISAELYEELGEQPFFKYPRFKLTDDPARLADKMRSDLSVSMNEQRGFRRYEDFLEYLRVKFEDAGTITLKSGLQDSFPTEDCRAFSFTDQQPYLILLNNKDTEGAKNFSLVHEFGHVLLRQAGICNNFRTFKVARKGVNEIEVFCNQFAANFLVPQANFLGSRVLSGKTKIDPSELDEVANQLAREFKASRVVILRRLLTFGYISQDLYQAKTKAWDKEVVPQRNPGGRFSLQTALRKNGRSFSSLVLEAYKQNKISYAGVSDYLGLKTKHLPSFEKLMNSYAG